MPQTKPQSTPKPTPQRSRQIACFPCRVDKKKCDHQKPTCLNCAQRQRQCIYPTPPLAQQVSPTSPLSTGGEQFLSSTTPDDIFPDIFISDAEVDLVADTVDFNAFLVHDVGDIPERPNEVPNNSGQNERLASETNHVDADTTNIVGHLDDCAENGEDATHLGPVAANVVQSASTPRPPKTGAPKNVVDAHATHNRPTSRHCTGPPQSSDGRKRSSQGRHHKIADVKTSKKRKRESTQQSTTSGAGGGSGGDGDGDGSGMGQIISFLQNFEKKIKDWENKYTALENENQDLENENQDLENENQGLENEKKALDNKYTALENEKKALDNKYTALENEKKALDNKYTALVNENNDLMSKLQQWITWWQNPTPMSNNGTASSKSANARPVFT